MSTVHCKCGARSPTRRNRPQTSAQSNVKCAACRHVFDRSFADLSLWQCQTDSRECMFVPAGLGPSLPLGLCSRARANRSPSGSERAFQVRTRARRPRSSCPAARLSRLWPRLPSVARRPAARSLPPGRLVKGPHGAPHGQDRNPSRGTRCSHTAPVAQRTRRVPLLAPGARRVPVLARRAHDGCQGLQSLGNGPSPLSSARPEGGRIHRNT